jgi:hypothetical protein
MILFDVHWWCTKRAVHHMRSGHVLRAVTFDWIGERVSDLYSVYKRF